MFNSPVLDTAIGLVFIFLLYSLLATSVNEAMATLFSFRARMLRKGIINGMLSDTPNNGNAWNNMMGSAKEFLLFIWRIISGERYKYSNQLGGLFYKHPIIKNYGTGNRFSVPSYLSKGNFSTIMIDVLNGMFEEHKTDIAAANPNICNLDNLATVLKIELLLKYFATLDDAAIAQMVTANKGVIDKETVKILLLHLNKSYQNIASFTESLETWYDDSMNRISGWYKRQTQFILFILGLFFAFSFNVDVLQITGKLSTDKNARDKLVQMAIAASEKYKDDPRVKRLDDSISKARLVTQADTVRQRRDTAEYNALVKQFNSQKDSIKKMLETDIAEANNLLALGWGDYGLKEFEKQVKKDKKQYDILISNRNVLLKSLEHEITDTAKDRTKDTTKTYNTALAEMYNKSTCILSPKIVYICGQTFFHKKLIGFLLLAFAVCLGSPFWFDLLQKLIKLRAAGKKEETGEPATNTNTPQPVHVTVNNNSNTDQEAVG